MEKSYNFKNGTVYVIAPDTYDHEGLRKATEDFLRKVIKERMRNDHSNTSGNIREKQVLD